MSNTIFVPRPVRSEILVFIDLGAFRPALLPADFGAFSVLIQGVPF